MGGGYEENQACSDRIWNALVQVEDNSNRTVEIIDTEKDPASQLCTYWISSGEVKERGSQLVDTKL